MQGGADRLGNCRLGFAGEFAGDHGEHLSGKEFPYQKVGCLRTIVNPAILLFALETDRLWD
jgi:hypothetical protein